MRRHAYAVDEDVETGDGGWPGGASVTPLPRRPAAPPAPRRSFLDRAWIVFAVLGLVAAAVAALWYLAVRPTPLSKEVTVPSVVGVGEQFAVAELTQAGLAVRAVEEPGDAKEGVVFAQHPAAQTILARGSRVTIDVANGDEPAAAATKPAETAKPATTKKTP